MKKRIMPIIAMLMISVSAGAWAWESIEQCTKAIKKNPQDWAAYVRRARVYSEKGDEKNAIKDFTRAIELNKHPNFSGNYGERGNHYRQIGDHANAIKDYTEALELALKNKKDYRKGWSQARDLAYIYYERAREYVTIGDHDNAIEDYTRALECVRADDDKDVIYKNEGYYERGQEFLKTGDNKKAIEDLRAAADERRKGIFVHNHQVTLEMIQKQIDDLSGGGNRKKEK